MPATVVSELIPPMKDRPTIPVNPASGLSGIRTELRFSYDHLGNPVSAQCTRCGQMMLKPGPDLRLSADIVFWFAEQFIEHKQTKHPPQPMDS